MADATTRSKPAEAVDEEFAKPHHKGDGISSEKPAEGADDVDPPTNGSPRG